MFDKELIFVNPKIKLETKYNIISYLLEGAYKNNYIDSVQEVMNSVIKRENEIPTEVGNYIAIPHGSSARIKKTFISVLVLDEKIKWNELYVKFVFLIGVPASERNDIHLKVLSKLSRNLMKEDFRNAIKDANNSLALYDILRKIED